MDPVWFSGSEIIEMAVRIEENGERFYKDAAAASKKDKLRKLFLYLAGEEKRHLDYFLALKEDTGDEKGMGLFNPDLEEASLYIKALAEGAVFRAKGATLAKKTEDEKEALDYAIEREKDSILFYCEFERIIREKDKGTLGILIGEERGHLRKLAEMRSELFIE